MTEQKILPPAKPSYKRRARNILIHKPMQLEFSFVLIALLMVSTLAVAFVIHSTVREMAFGGGYHFGKVSPYEMLSELSYQLVIRVSSILLITLGVIATFGIFFLHRVAGPVYRFRRIFMQLNEGEVPREIRLREGDFFSETASEINIFLKKIRSEKEKSDEMKQKVEQILAGHPAEPLARMARELKTLLDRQPE